MTTWTRSPFRRIGTLLWQTFWGLPTCMLVATIAIVAALLRLDDSGASSALARLGWPFDFGGKTAQALAGALADVHVALVALYFSITLLVLTLAAGTLGVRLVHRWMTSLVTRLTLGMLLSSLAWSLIVLQAIDADANAAHVARLTLSVLVALTLGIIGWLAFALHDLGRTVHIDTAIADLRDEAVADVGGFARCAVAVRQEIDWAATRPIVATKDGYIESIGFDAIAEIAARTSDSVRITGGIGSFVLAGETIGRTTSADDDAACDIARQVSIGRYRTSSQGAVFYVRLLVEIAARALSPAINDFYTGLACVDALGPVMVAHAKLPQDRPWRTDKAGTPRVLVDLMPFEDLFDAPLRSLRQAAVSYPSVTVHLLSILRRVTDQVSDPVLVDFLRHHVRTLSEHALLETAYEPDREAIERASSHDAAAW